MNTAMLASLVLQWLAKRPSTTRELEDLAKTSGTWGPGAVYGTLRRLEHRGVVDGLRMPGAPILWWLR